MNHQPPETLTGDTAVSAVDEQQQLGLSISNCGTGILQTWLIQQLEQERNFLVHTLEERHRNLLRRFKQQVDTLHPWSEADNNIIDIDLLVHDMEASTSASKQSKEESKQSISWNQVASELVSDSSEESPKQIRSTNSKKNGKRRSTPYIIGDAMSYLKMPLHMIGYHTAAAEQSEEPRSHGRMSITQSSSTVLLRSYSAFEGAVKGHAFEWFWAAVILANACVMAMQQQFNGLQLGYELNVRTYNSSADTAWPAGDDVFTNLEKMFTVLFTIEIVARLVAYRWKYLHDHWSYIDLAIVITAWVLWIAGDDALAVNPTFARLARFGRLMRIVKLLRSNNIIDCLKILIAAIRASVNTLFWSLTVLILIQSVAGLFLSQLLQTFIGDTAHDAEVRKKVFLYFGTFWRSMITMFEITFANWAPSCRVLVDDVDELYGIFFIFYRCVIGFSVLMVIQAVFIQQTMKTTQLDDEFLAQQKIREKRKLVGRLHNIFNKIDASGDGLVSCEEFVPALKDGPMQGILETCEIEVSDLETLFALLDDGDGQISAESFVKGITSMKGPAKAIDLLEVSEMMKRLENRFDAFMGNALGPRNTRNTRQTCHYSNSAS